MVERLKGITRAFGDAKSRAIIIFTLVIFIVAVGIGLSGMHKRIGSTPAGASSNVSAPAVRSLPGSQTDSQNYIDLQQKANEQAVQKAKATGTSAIPTLLDSLRTGQEGAGGAANGSQDQGQRSVTLVQGSISGEQSAQGAVAGVNTNGMNQPSGEDVYAQSLAQQAKYQQLALAQANQKQLQQATDDYSKNMTRVAKALVSSWAPQKQVYTNGKETQDMATTAQSGDATYAGGAAGSAGLVAASASQQAIRDSVRTGAQVGGQFTQPIRQGQHLQGQQAGPIYKTGTILYAVIATSINSDTPGPVLATIESGPLQGAKLIGSIKRQKDKVYIKFSTINIPSKANSVKIDAVAVDPNTSQTALADNVDNHTLMRYSTLLGSAFLEGLGEAAQSGNTSVTINNSDGTIESFGDLNASQQLIAALGTVGQRWGSAMGNAFQRPPTVYVYAGSSVGVLILKDFSTLSKQ